MGDYLIVLLIVLFIIAIFLREDFVFTILYAVIGALILGRFWSSKALNAVSASRIYTDRLFLGEKARVQVRIINKGWLPAVWLQVQENLPVELAGPDTFHQVVSLGPREKLQFDYYVEGRKRGYYHIGPMRFYSGDVLGIRDRIQRLHEAQRMTVYPKIVPLTRVDLPSSSPLGVMRHNQPIFEDPSRVIGKRDYVVGDSLRRVDWKATAASNRVQVKQLEPSISLETSIFLNLNTDEYDQRTWIDATELAIVIAASLANWIISRRQAVGLVTNGVDPLMNGERPPSMPPRRSRGHLMRLLDILARVETADKEPFVHLINQESVRLTWGTTIIIITGQIDDDLFDSLFRARRRGLHAVVVLAGLGAGSEEVRRKSASFGYPLYTIHRERDLDIWRR